jgi:hypothetical protein
VIIGYKMVDLTKLHKMKRKVPEADLNFTIDENNDLKEEIKPYELIVEKERFARLRKLKLTRKHYIITGLGLLVLAIIGTLILTTRPVDKAVIVKTKKAAVVAKPIIYYSPLSGVVVTKAESQLPVTGIMIENSDDARPQSGMSQAGVVFEALAEGGISRFLVLYQEGQPNSIGPIRSARPYFVDWALPFDATYVHVGGSPDGLAEIQANNVKNVDEFYYGSDFTRITSRYAPHNVYTSMPTLLSLEATLGFNVSTFTSFPRKVDLPAKLPTASTINFTLSSADFAVNYIYQKANNSYLRSEGGAPMIDANTNAQLDPKVVIAIVVPWTNGILDASGAYYVDYSNIGSGTCYVFQDGTVTTGTWAKPSTSSQITFSDATGNPIKLNAGQTWITAVSSASAVSYQ